MNHTQIIEAEKYAANVSKQTIYKTPLDFASPLAYHKQLAKSNTELNIVHNLEGMDSVIDTHSIDQFHPKPSEIVGDVVKVETYISRFHREVELDTLSELQRLCTKSPRMSKRTRTSRRSV